MFSVLTQKYNDLTITQKGTWTPVLNGFTLTPVSAGQITGDYVVLMNKICCFNFQFYFSAASDISATDVSMTFPVKSIPENDQGNFKCYTTQIDWDATNSFGVFFSVTNSSFGSPPPPAAPLAVFYSYKEAAPVPLATASITSGSFPKFIIAHGWYMTNGELV